MGSVPRVGPQGWELVLGLCAGKERGVPWVRTCPGGAPGSIPALCPPHRECQQDAALWQTLRLDQRVSLDELLNISQVSAKEGHNTGGDMGLALCPAPPHGSPHPAVHREDLSGFPEAEHHADPHLCTEREPAGAAAECLPRCTAPQLHPHPAAGVGLRSGWGGLGAVPAPSCPMGMGCSPAVVLTSAPPQHCVFPSWIRASRWAACRSWPQSWSSWWAMR